MAFQITTLAHGLSRRCSLFGIITREPLIRKMWKTKTCG
jgi:hypothetical protein